ncbi:murein biosynthesis integral membrane protein MurJ [Thermocoleostomius sinensis]|uniref:Probable lipid II flippase MurJ n=1 Tax=Thermocoleostomius sinensis A174 TaxID=2016057 RepID=A0A9E9C9H1_9CYAN|nr:murein biosynthesis integral membrane protein MurJ [Thermocoleostomius sinensis]WAL61578.1 murein biosynthesis integral membrane protein MurJ [Thermocoleostomius sinensis A174]
MSDAKKNSRSLVGIAGIVAAATLLSKLFGLFRQQAIAAAFGVGVVADAYNYAYVIPSFFFVLLGGINGPFHSAIVSVVSKRKREEIAPLIETISTLVGGVLILATALLILFADPLIDLVAPGLGQTATGLETKAIAVQQLRIMAPMALFAGLIGIGFGVLNADDQYWLPSISPLLSSVTVLVGLGGLLLFVGQDLISPEYSLLGGQILAWGTLAGAILQWLVQVPAQWRSGLGRLRLRFDFNRSGVKETVRLMGPATLSSGMTQINVYTDLFFASFIPQAAAALGYANLLVQTPVGIISNMILVPFLPVFSRLAAPEHWEELKLRIRQGLVMTAITMLPLGAIIIALALPIVRVVYERYAFDQEASQIVTSVLIAYSIGMFVYLARDVLVRVFYALGDADTPFRISVINIFLNALLDYLLIRPFGAAGLVLATVGVNIISTVWLLTVLNRKLHGLPLQEWGLPIGGLGLGSVVTGLASWGTLFALQRGLGTEGFFVQLLQLVVAGTVGLLVFALIAMQMQLPEVDQLVTRLRQRFGRSA